MRQDAEDAESSPLLSGTVEDPDKVFTRALDHDLEKICSFYQLKELEIYGEVDALLRDEHAFELEHDGVDGDDGRSGRRSSFMPKRQGSIFKNFGFGGKKRRTSTMSRSREEIIEEDESDEEANERSILKKTPPKDGPKNVDMSASQNTLDERDDFRLSNEDRRRPSTTFDEDQALSELYDAGVTLKKRTISLYVNLCELRSFIQLNKTGFSKVLKKYDKTLDRKLKSQYVKENVDPAYPFKQETMDHLTDNIQKIEQAYADIVTRGDVELARRELRLHLREHVVWERNTVWREMIGIERKAQAANMGIRQTMLGRDTDPSKARLQGDEPEEATKEVVTPIGKYRCPRFLLTSTFYILLGIFALFMILLLVPIMDKPEQQNCLALVVLVSLLWATEVIMRILAFAEIDVDLSVRQFRCSSLPFLYRSWWSSSGL